jgi:hypothetical protein
MSSERRTSPLRQLAFWVVLLTVAAVVGASAQRSGNEPHPQELRIVGPHQTVIGLVYSPETLAALVAKSSQPAPAHVVQALDRRTPIVVIWTVPVPPELAQAPPPYKMTIVEHDPVEVTKVDPVWLEHDPSDLAVLDGRVRSHDVGAIAAFPRSAFVRGRYVCLYSDYPPDEEKKSHRSIRRCGLIE